MNWTATGAMLLTAAVILGAFGAHGLRGRLDAYQLDVYEKAVFYHFVHAIGVLVAPLLAQAGMVPKKAALWAGRLLLAGILLFSGSLYLLALTGVSTFGIVTPFGGIAFIVGWAVLAYGAVRGKAG
jgi:uncharacterized membrane protein YgdD (TMEM256/DUF423 family)